MPSLEGQRHKKLYPRVPGYEDRDEKRVQVPLLFPGRGVGGHWHTPCTSQASFPAALMPAEGKAARTWLQPPRQEPPSLGRDATDVPLKIKPGLLPPHLEDF